MFKLCAIVSSHFPDLDELEQNIQSYLYGVDKLIIWENTPQNESRIAEFAENLNNSKIEIRTTGKNEFLAKPFNTCIKWAKENGYTHILTLDQDSRFVTGHFAEYIQKIKNFDDASVGIFAPHIASIYKFANTQTETAEVERALISGSVFPLAVFEKSGMFREDFLIDAVDTEFSLRARTNGFKIICFPAVKLLHESGQRIKTKFGIVLNNYSAQRTYYILRNHIILRKLYAQFDLSKDKKAFYKYGVFYRLAKLCFEKDALHKLKAIILGLSHGYCGRTGKYDI